MVGISGSVEIVHAQNEDAGDILATVAGSMVIPGGRGGAGLIGGGSPLVVLSPEHAASLVAAGLSRADVQRELWERARMPAAVGAMPTSLRIAGATGGEATSGGAELTVARTAEDILVAVAGGVGVKSTYLPSWGGGTRAITVPVP